MKELKQAIRNLFRHMYNNDNIIWSRNDEDEFLCMEWCELGLALTDEGDVAIASRLFLTNYHNEMFTLTYTDESHRHKTIKLIDNLRDALDNTDCM